MRDGIVIRPLGSRDTADLYYVRIAPEVMSETLGLPTLTSDRWGREVESMVGNPNNHCLVAEVEGRVVGAVNLEVLRGRKSHGGTLGLMVRDDHHGRGIGAALLDGMLEVADRWLGLRRVELEVFADNQVAIGLYERRGFLREGIKRGAAYRDGKYEDILVMARHRADA